MPRPILAAVLLTTFVATLEAAPVPVVPPDPSKDREGNPLPKGATARLGSLAFRGWVQCPVFSADSKRLFVASDGQVFAWDVDTGQPLKTKAFAPADKKLLTGFRGMVFGERVIWLGLKEVGGPKNHTTRVVVTDLDGVAVSQFDLAGTASGGFSFIPAQLGQVAVSADTKYLAVIPDRSNVLSVYAIETGKQLYSHKVEQARLGALYIPPDGKTLVAREAGKPMRRWGLPSGKELSALEETDDNINQMAGSPDGKHLVTRRLVMRRDAAGKVTGIERDEFLVVRGESGKPLGKLEVKGWPSCFGFAGSESILVVTQRGFFPGPELATLSRWNVSTRKKEWEVSCPWSDWMSVSPNGKRVVIADQRLPLMWLYDTGTGKPVVTPRGHDGPLIWLGFSADGSAVTTVGGGSVSTWARTGERISAAAIPELAQSRMDPPPGRNGGRGLAWLTLRNDGKPAALVGWDAAKGAVGWRMALDPKLPAMQTLDTPDGKRIVSVAWDGAKRSAKVLVFDGPAGKKLADWGLPIGAPMAGPPPIGWSPAVALSGDGKLLFVGGDGVTGYDVESGKEKVKVKDARIPPAEFRSSSPMAASGDGSRIALADARSVRVYDVKAGKLLASHQRSGAPWASVKFSPDGRQVALWPDGGRGVLVCPADSDAKPRLFEGGQFVPTTVAFSPNGANLAVGYKDGTALIWDLTTK